MCRYKNKIINKHKYTYLGYNLYKKFNAGYVTTKKNLLYFFKKLR